MVYFAPIPSHVEVSSRKSEQLTMPPLSTEPPLPELTPNLSDLTQAQRMELALTALENLPSPFNDQRSNIMTGAWTERLEDTLQNTNVHSVRILHKCE